ncbi:MAG: serine hydrolase [Gemmatimonadetes bacterium]|nr:serine hydrolase [Gemmatimonadota bacterium]
MGASLPGARMLAAAALSVMLGAVVAACAAAPSLEDQVRSWVDALDAKTSVYAKHLPTGREIAIRADEPMNTLSVIKLPVMVLAYRDAEAGILDLNERYVVAPEDMRRGSGVLQHFAPGLQPTYRDIITEMIITSDNSATDIMIKRVGLERVNEMLAALGYRETRLKSTTGGRFRRVLEFADPAAASLSDREVFERGSPADPAARERFVRDSAEWLGRSTAREMSRLLEQLHNGELASPEHTSEMIDILKRQVSSSRLPQRIRFQDVVLAHKTGDWAPYSGSDVGILYYEGGPTVVSVFTNENRGDFVELEAAIGRIAEDLVKAWR